MQIHPNEAEERGRKEERKVLRGVMRTRVGGVGVGGLSGSHVTSTGLDGNDCRCFVQKRIGCEKFVAFGVVFLSLINMSGEHLAGGKMSQLIKAEKSRFAV